MTIFYNAAPSPVGGVYCYRVQEGYWPSWYESPSESLWMVPGTFDWNGRSTAR